MTVAPDEETQRATSVDTPNNNENLRYVEAKSLTYPPFPAIE